MTDLVNGTAAHIGGADIESTPLHRVAGQLQRVLPQGWEVSVAAAHTPVLSGPVLRVRGPQQR